MPRCTATAGFDENAYSNTLTYDNTVEIDSG